MIITLKAKYSLHSEYKGVPIYKREACTGTSGGNWKAVSTTCKSLKQAQAQIDETEACGNLAIYRKYWEEKKAAEAAK